MITDKQLKKVGEEMVRLSKAIKAHEDRCKRDAEYERFYPITGGPETAAIRRASMDLSRALSELRGRSGT